MARFNSRAKGNRHERAVAKMLTDWWGGDCTFRRTPLSGGWDKRAQADLIVPPDFNACIEIKARQSWTWENLLFNEECEFWEWWKFNEIQAREVQRYPWLIFTKNHHPYYLAHNDCRLNFRLEMWHSIFNEKIYFCTLVDILTDTNKEMLRRKPNAG